jgi:hypothetical protein
MDLFEIENLDDDRCFLCGVRLTDANQSDEHVFPVWLQHKGGLWDQNMVLLNRTSIPYRQLVIPCCTTCNTRYLSNLEQDVCDAFAGGYPAVRKMPQIQLFQWCSKIYYGLLHKELTLLADRKQPSLGAILDKQSLQEFKTHHLFMQSIRVPYVFLEFSPASVFVLRTHTCDDTRQNFDYMDSIWFVEPGIATQSPGIAVRCHDVGVICLFDDLGLQQHNFQIEFDTFEGHELHPIQFIELATKALYKHSLKAYETDYLTWPVPTDDEPYITAPASWPVGELWREWHNDKYMALFKRNLSRGANELPDAVQACPQGQMWTSLRRSDGTALFVDKYGAPL